MMNDLVTVIVPVYKVEKFLNRCVSSILNQTYRNLEIILVDDGSPDGCPQMCDAWACKDSRIKVIHKENAGLGMARNTGIENASGEYICFFDSDDYVAEDTIEKAYQLAEREQADLVVFGMANVDKNGKIIRELVLETTKGCFHGSEVQEQFLPDLIDGRHSDVKNKNLCLSACSCLYSMELIKRTGWRFVSERSNISEDSYSLIWLYRYVSKVAILPDALYFYCENGTSLSRTYRQDRFDRIKQFYHESSAMATAQGYGEVVQTRIAGLFLSFTIAAMKQIADADFEKVQKKKLISQITRDELTQQILADPACRYSSRMRAILFWAMRNRMNQMVYLLLKMRTKKESQS